MTHRPALLLTALVLALGGCSSPVKLDKPAADAAAPNDAAAAAAAAAANAANAAAAARAGGSTMITEVDTPSAKRGAAGPGGDVPRSVYFAFDSYVVEDSYRPVLSGNARYLTAHPNVPVQLQGNTDARGSRAYNMALGQKRAEAVLKGLALQGVNTSQMEAVSFGKEKPASGDDAQNRRTDIVYK